MISCKLRVCIFNFLGKSSLFLKRSVVFWKGQSGFVAAWCEYLPWKAVIVLKYGGALRKPAMGITKRYRKRFEAHGDARMCNRMRQVSEIDAMIR